MTVWTEAQVEWQFGVDSLEEYRQFFRGAELLATWPASPLDNAATECFRLGDRYWIWQPGMGGACVSANHPALTAVPDTDIPRSRFEPLITRSWLPAIYPLWGRQVVHASAAFERGTGDVVAFVGPSTAGKSTFAYGLSRRRRWQHLSDDTLAFSQTDDRISLHQLTNDVRLRLATAGHYGKTGQAGQSIKWPDTRLTLARVYFLQSDPDISVSAILTPMSAADSYRGLLEQAYALTLEVPEHNRRLMVDYLALATVPSFRLTYRKSFESIESIFDEIENHTGAAQFR